MSEKTREDLLNELSSYLHESGRKRRSDKGRPHRTVFEPYNRVNQKMATYNRLKAQLANRDKKLRAESNQGTTILSKEFDCNGFYLPIPESYATRSTLYKQEYHGRQIVHTTARVRVQKYIDMEKYRFEAFQYHALTYPEQIVEPSDDIRGILFARYGFTTEQSNEAIKNRGITWLEWFEELYYIPHADISKYDYDTWKSYYSCIPAGTALDDDFRFIYGVLPGSEDFHPEWSSYVEEQQEIAKDEEQQEKERQKAQFVANMQNNRPES